MTHEHRPAIVRDTEPEPRNSDDQMSFWFAMREMEHPDDYWKRNQKAKRENRKRWHESHKYQRLERGRMA